MSQVEVEPEPRPGRLTAWLEKASPAVFACYAIGASFSTYFCMYAFRKPFAAANYQNEVRLWNLEFWREGDVLFGRNHAVNDSYLLGWSCNPQDASRSSSRSDSASQVLLWHANYHPDGQLFFPLDGSPFVVPLALPGDDVRPENFVAFYFAGHEGLYLHPDIWHEGVFPLRPRARFHDEQGKVHARVSCNFAKEFGVFLAVPLREV